MIKEELESVTLAEDARWYVVSTYSGYENKVAADIEKSVENKNLGHLVFEVYIPTDTVIEVKERGKVESKKVRYPGYVFVKMLLTEDSWAHIMSVKGVTSFVGPGGKPQPLSSEEAYEMGIGKTNVEVSYSVGQFVEIVEGPFKDHKGTVDEIDKENDMVRVRVPMFGRETPVELRLHQARPVN